MTAIAIAFSWGAFFGTVLLMLAGALAAFAASHHRVALGAALGAVVSAFFVVCFLGWLPLGAPGMQDRVLAHVGIFSATMLGLMLLADLGLLRDRGRRHRVLARMLAVAALAVAVSWLLPPWPALALGCGVALAVGASGLAIGVRSAERGDRPAWAAVFAVTSMLVSLGGVSWIALDRGGVPWGVHIVSALAGMAYLTGIGVMLWLRYSYLIEVQEVRAQGPRYDPITRMRSSTATAHLVAQVFHRQQHAPSRPIMLIAVSIGNLYALENLHGRAALNHALFICATRLRRCAPPDMEIGRLFEDGFLLISRDARDLDRLVRLGRLIARRLSRPVTLSTGNGNGNGDGTQEPARAEWAAQVGVGLLATTALSPPAAVVGKVRDMSRTAWTYASRVAWLDQASDMIAELPALDTAT
jgi:GGDEF domain-containing protein